MDAKGMDLGRRLSSSKLCFSTNGKAIRDVKFTEESLTPSQWYQAPLDRAFINAGRLMPLLLNRALSDEKRLLTTDPWRWRASRLTNLLRVPQFVQT